MHLSTGASLREWRWRAFRRTALAERRKLGDVRAGTQSGGAVHPRRRQGEHVEPLGSARVRREGSDVTIAALAAMVPKAMRAADVLENEHNISATVIDVRTLVPLDTSTIFEEVKKTGRLVTVEENPRLCGWGAEISSLVVEEMFWDLEGPIVRVTTPHVPLPAADALEDSVIPSVERIVDNVLKLAD
jgi:pyruvate dehydrogenase E1 component beta subunit